MGGWAGVEDCRAAWKRWRSVLRFRIVDCKAMRASISFEGPIFEYCRGVKA